MRKYTHEIVVRALKSLLCTIRQLLTVHSNKIRAKVLNYWIKSLHLFLKCRPRIRQLVRLTMNLRHEHEHIDRST